MNGLDLYERTKLLADRLEKMPRFTLAFLLSQHVLFQALERHADDASVEALMDSLAAKAVEECLQLNKTARMRSASRRMNRLLAQLQNPTPKRRRRKLRRAARA